MRDVADAGADIGQRARRFGLRAHRHQHAAHIRVMNDAHRPGRAGQVARLHPVPGKRQRLLVRAVGQTDSLYPYPEAGRVHHDEHGFKTAVLRADQGADRASMVAELQHRRRAGPDAELVFDRHAMHVVARARRAIRLHHEFRHDEQ